MIQFVSSSKDYVMIEVIQVTNNNNIRRLSQI